MPRRSLRAWRGGPFRLLLGAALICVAISTSAQAESRPNVLILFADDLGFSDLGCYGGEISTPNLDRLAEHGLRFTQFYNTARCWPSRAALLTGYYPQQVRRDTVPGIRSGSQGVRPGWAKLLPEILRPAGYRTYHSGKWHVDGAPTENGFDRSYDLTDQNRYFSPQSHSEDGKPLAAISDQSYYATTAIADHAIKCLVEHQAEFSDRPFFHYVCFTAPHFPLQAPQADIDTYCDAYVLGWDEVRDARWMRLKSKGIIHHALPAMEREVGPPYHFADVLEKTGPGEVNRPIAWNELNAVQQAFQSVKMAIHAAMVDRMDRELGRILAQVQAMRADENTLVLFLSDNGASAEMMIRGSGHDPAANPGSAPTHLCLGPGWSSAANTPLRRHKTWVHEGGISTPCIAYWPLGIAARGALSHQPAHLIDLVPTILEVTGTPAPDTWQDRPIPQRPGQSLVKKFAISGTSRSADEAKVAREFLWWCHEDNRAVRVGDWKLVAPKAGEWELYDLASDRGESNNLADDHADRVRELEQIWKREFKSQVRWATE